jgi:hypothetical protein
MAAPDAPTFQQEERAQGAILFQVAQNHVDQHSQFSLPWWFSHSRFRQKAPLQTPAGDPGSRQFQNFLWWAFSYFPDNSATKLSSINTTLKMVRKSTRSQVFP